MWSFQVEWSCGLCLLLLALGMASKDRPTNFEKELSVHKCPNIPVMRNVSKQKLLGVWYAFATTPLPFVNYQRQCASYNVKDSPYFETNVLYTNYKSLTITYACNYNEEQKMFDIKLRILTRTRTPTAETVKEALKVLSKVRFPFETLKWLKSEAFCFEWYILKFETRKRPKEYQAPYNGLYDD